MRAQIKIQKLLIEKLTESRLRNPSYSLRAFAGKIGLPASALSEILNGKRNLSRERTKMVLQRLCVDPDSAARLLSEFPDQIKYNRKKQVDAIAYTSLSMDHFRVISDWYHFAILSLSETEDYRHEPKWIAKRLNIRTDEAAAALERLERIEMIEFDKMSGKVVQTGVSYTTSDDIADLSLRKVHGQNLEIARNSLEKDGVMQRDFTSVTMAIDPEQLPVAKKMIRQFQDHLCATLESGRKKEVYKLCVQLIPLTQVG